MEEINRLLDLLNTNGFNVQSFRAFNHKAELVYVDVRVYPRKPDSTKDEGK